MTTDTQFSGVLVPVLTPFGSDLMPDSAAFIEHCRWLLAQGADGLAIFGTTGEANSLSVEEKMDLLDALIEGGIPATRLMPGTGMCALTDSVRLTSHATKMGCGGVLMLPPFYYKGVPDDGLCAGFSEVIERVGDPRLRVYLYHIPPVSQVPISLNLIERLITSYPGVVVGLKDSSGEWSNTLSVLQRFPGFITFAGSEVFLLDTLRNGGSGCITATGNVNPGGIRKVYEQWRHPQADALQMRITEIRNAIQSYPMIPALKTIISNFYDDPKWLTVRPPLLCLDSTQRKALMDEIGALEFSMDNNTTCVAVG
jgi:4-hydroxy-tetrahydrodipicolinate synthase